MDNTMITSTCNPDAGRNLSFLCEEILSLLITGSSIEHSMLEKLMSILFTHFFETNNDIGTVFDDLSDAIKIAYQTASFSQKYEQGFEMGILYSMMFCVDQNQRKQKNDFEIDYLKNYVENENRALLINIIEKTEGINQTAILYRYNLSFPEKKIKKARLSQMLTELKDRKIVYCTSIGKEKHYYLTRRGKYLADYVKHSIPIKQAMMNEMAERMRMLELCRTIGKKDAYQRSSSNETSIIEVLPIALDGHNNPITYTVAYG